MTDFKSTTNASETKKNIKKDRHYKIRNKKKQHLNTVHKCTT